MTPVSDPVTAIYPKAILNIESWEEAVAMGMTFAEEMDKWRWALGALASFVRTSLPSGGRPRKESDKRGTVSQLADDIGIRRERLSAYCAMFDFYAPIKDSIPENATWEMLSQARKGCGREADEEVKSIHRERALQLVAQAADRTYPRPKPTMQDRIEAERERLLRLVELADTNNERLIHHLRMAVGALEDAADAI